MAKLLIIDDEELFLNSISEQLNLRGYENITSTTGKDIEHLLSKNSDIDVVLLDMRMPDVSGDEILKRIKKFKPEVQVVILTGFGDTETAVEMAHQDAFSFLQKPVEIQKLTEILDKARSKAKFLISQQKQAQGKSVKEMAFWTAISVSIGLIIALLPVPSDLPPRAHYFLAFLIAIIMLWITEGLPIGITALLVGSGMVLFGIQKPEAAWTPYASPAVMFVMMIIMFGVILNEVGLTQRILQGVLKVAGRKIIPFSFFICLVSSIVSTAFHDATVTIIFLFALIPVFKQMKILPHNSNNFTKFFSLLIPLSASAGGFGTILGGGRNPIAIDFLEKHAGIHIGFFEWIVYQFPLVIFVSAATWVICYLLFPPKVKELPETFEAKKMPPMSKQEKGVAIIFALALILWALGDLTHLHVSVVAAIAILAICCLRLVSFKQVIQKFAWDAWLVFGAGVSLGAAMLDTGAGKWLAEQFAPLLIGQPKAIQYFGIAIFGSFISSFMSNSAATALCLPIMFPLAKELGIQITEIGLILPAATSFIWLVIGCPPTIIAYSTGYFSQLEFCKVAIPWAILCVFVYSVLISAYWPLLGI